MKNTQVQFSTRARTVKSARNELRARCRKSPGFLRLLRLAANEQLKGRAPTLSASNRAALRALEYAVCKLRQQNEIGLSEGVAARPAYLMRKKTDNSKRRPWMEVHKATAVHAMQETTLDTLAVMPVWVYSPTISHRAARKLEALTAPELVTVEEAPLEYRENRESESAHPNPFTEDASTYNDAGELETPTERRERLTREQKTPRRETWEDAWKPLPLKEKGERPAPTPVRELPAAPYYYAAQHQFPEWVKREMQRRQAADDARRVKLGQDASEVVALAELDELLSPEELEQDMLEPWEALERYATNR